MKYVLTLAALAVLAVALPLRADDKDKPKDKPKDEKPSMEKKFGEIAEQFRKAQEPLGKEFQAAKTDEEREAIVAKLPKIGKPFADQAVKLAEEDLKDAFAIQPLMFALMVGKSERAAELLFETQTEKKEFREILSGMGGQGGDNPAATKLLKLSAEKSTNKEIQGIATLALAQMLYGQSDSEKDATKAEAAAKEAEAYAVKVTKDFADVNGASGKLGKEAEDVLFQIRNLGVGKAAPEVVSKDLDDKEVKLSALKGKVVVMDIWATWCGPCRAMIPHEREMVEKLKGKPFTLVSISADAKKEDLKEFLEKEKMPWTHWWEGKNEKGILKQWNVHFFPTIYVLDAKGVIRFKNIRGKKLEEAVEQLVKEAESKS